MNLKLLNMGSLINYMAVRGVLEGGHYVHFRIKATQCVSLIVRRHHGALFFIEFPKMPYHNEGPWCAQNGECRVVVAMKLQTKTKQTSDPSGQR